MEGGVHHLRGRPRSGQTPSGQTPPRQTPPWADTPPGRHSLPETATAADGTHPTGMLSCRYIILIGNVA